MFSRLASTAVVMLAASSLTSAQTFSACDPTKKDGCPPNPAVASEQTIDFTKGENDFFTPAVGTTVKYDPSLGAVFTINKETDAPTFTSTGYIFFGRVDVVVRASVGTGVVTSIVLQSDNLDEIDWEFLGGDDTQVQTNYFSKGDTTTYDRGGFSGVANPQSEFHTYTIDWTAEKLDWIIDGTVVRTLKYADAKGGAAYPQTPMQVKLGTWVAGRKDAAEGTVQWAGGYTDFSQAPFNGYYKSVTVKDYMNGAKSAGSYVYGDRSGSYQSIKIEQGDGKGDGAQSSSTKSSASTMSTVTSSARLTASVTQGITLATGGPNSNNSSSDSDSSDAPTPTSSGSGSGSGSGSSSESSPSVVTAGASSKAGINLAFMGAAMFALLSL
ncbi:cell wall glucanosyltransferase Mwg1 [Diaporthe helianthi]|uniref:Crh-like protein n=1 Tax=Diaporthe helianthi TaxID=158607 RepID=A0A2P5I0D3_DIAHE|nr:cell wall glucanosyltransferase Mwg1 [Diaporthe helianthi]